ncbi:MAG: NlpC/P60 family protein, partial [Chloroflexi bacterium]|nr:NlpC/P60 family protein [Chloroflexota bacterium]
AALSVAVLLLHLTALAALASEEKATPAPSQDSTQPAPAVDHPQTNSDAPGGELTVVLRLNDNSSPQPSYPASARRPKPRQAAKPQPKSLCALDRVREIATRFLGVPYRWGGTTPSAFDCSGFTRYIYAKLGIQLPRTAREQFRTGQPVKAGEWKPGDLIFFDMMKGYISHVGMYLGGGHFIHASTPMSGVKIDSLSKPCYKKCYAGARRYATA